VAGQYVKAGKLSDIDYYEETFEISEGEEGKARVIIQNSGMLEERLRKEKGSFKRWQTCQVIKIEKSESKAPTKKEDKEKLGLEVEVQELLAKASSLGCVPAAYKNMGSDKLRKMALEEAIARNEKRRKKSEKTISKADGALEDGYI